MRLTVDFRWDDIPTEDYLRKETSFWRLTENREIVFPCWDKLGFSKFWWDYILDDNPRELVCVGRGGGKGYNLLFKRVWRAFRMYQEVKASGIRYAGAQWHLLIVAPTEENFTSTVAKLLEMVPQIPGLAPDGNLNYRFRKSDDVDFKLFGENELLITVLSTYNADNLRGKDADDLLIDEAFKVKYSDVTDVLIQVVQRQGRPPQGGFFTACSTPDTELLLDPWFDAACDQADPTTETKGFFDNFKLWEGDFATNPYISERLWDQILREAMLNLTKFQRERLGVRGLIVEETNLDGTVGNIITREMLEACFYREKITPTKIIISIDLSFGTQDSLTRVFMDKTTGCVFGIDIYDVKDQNQMGINSGEFTHGLLEFFKKTAAHYPTATILYDATGQNAGAIQRLMPGHIRARGIVKNARKKNALVETLLERMMLAGGNGGIRFPELSADWLTPQQRANFKRLYTEMVNYRKLIVFDKFTNAKSYRYTKVAPYSDDCIDGVAMLMEETQAVTAPGRLSLSEARRRAGR